MRIAAAVIGGLGALLGAVKGLLFILMVLLLGPLQTDMFSPFNFLAISSDGAVAIFCILGATGAGLVLTGRRARAGILLMPLGAAGVTVTAVAYGLLPLTQPSAVQAALGVFPTDLGFYVVWLFPILPLLVGAALAFLARRRSSSQPTSC